VDHQTTRRITVRATIVGVLALAGSAGTAGAQNALGDGRLLDNNLSAQGTANTPVRDLDAEIRFRNAIVTGNAPGGLSFRGDVGYTAPGEFRGELGSDSTFAFRRDSLVSGLAGAGIRGIDALQYQMALTTGSMPPQSLVGGLLGRPRRVQRRLAPPRLPALGRAARRDALVPSRRVRDRAATRDG
jgi:hypothetical protein